MIPCIFNDVREAILEGLGLTEARWDTARVLIFTGENASGKSLLRRVFMTFLKKHNIEVLHLSQEGRSRGGFERVMIYGSEEDEATSVLSARSLVNGMKTSRERERDHILLYDEPEIGMSEESSLGAAQWIRAELEKEWPAKLCGIVVMTHNRHFVSELTRMSDSHFFWMHNLGKTAQEWLDRSIKPVTPPELVEFGLQNWHKFNDILKSSAPKKK